MHSVGMNGAMVYNADDELIYAKPLKKDLLEELLKAFPDIGFECVGYDHIFVTDSRERHAVYGGRKGLMGLVMRPMRAKFLAGCRFDQTMADILGRDILKVNCHVHDPARERDLKDFVAAHADRVVNAPFDPCMFELTDKDVNKGTAVAYLARYLGIEEGEVAVYGALQARLRHKQRQRRGKARRRQRDRQLRVLRRAAPYHAHGARAALAAPRFLRRLRVLRASVAASPQQISALWQEGRTSRHGALCVLMQGSA